MTRIPLASEKTLRDEFAGQALANSNIEEHSGKGWPDRVASQAYAIASAMLAEKARLEAEEHGAHPAAAESDWDTNSLAVALGGQPGEDQKAVIQREVPKLIQANKELVEALRLAVTHVEFFTSPPKGSIAEDGRNALLLKFRTILAKHKESK